MSTRPCATMALSALLPLDRVVSSLKFATAARHACTYTARSRSERAASVATADGRAFPTEATTTSALDQHAAASRAAASALTPKALDKTFLVFSRSSAHDVGGTVAMSSCPCMHIACTCIPLNGP